VSGGGSRRDLFKAFPPERMGEPRQSPALGVGEAEPGATEVGFEDTVCREEVGDDLLLVTLEPAGNHGHQELRIIAGSQPGGRDAIVRSGIHPV
jgi:hypothetical protein